MNKEELLNQSIRLKTNEKLNVLRVNDFSDIHDCNLTVDNGKTFNLYVSYKSGYLRFQNDDLNSEMDACLKTDLDLEKERIERNTSIIKRLKELETRRKEEGVIDKFRDDYRFLSNFYPCKVEFSGITYLNSEAAFQAQKDPSRAEEFATLSAAKAKQLGRKVTLRKDWERVKVQIMAELLDCKFTQNPVLKLKLIETGSKKLIEGNTWGDTFWGMSSRTGKGRNALGQLLMKLRARYQEEEKKTVA